MNKEKLGQEPAFANSETYNPNNMEANGMFSPGMSKRFYAACTAMQGLLANTNTARQLSRQLPKSASIDDCYVSVVATAYAMADEILKQENK